LVVLYNMSVAGVRVVEFVTSWCPLVVLYNMSVAGVRVVEFGPN